MTFSIYIPVIDVLHLCAMFYVFEGVLYSSFLKILILISIPFRSSMLKCPCCSLGDDALNFAVWYTMRIKYLTLLYLSFNKKLLIWATARTTVRAAVLQIFWFENSLTNNAENIHHLLYYACRNELMQW